MEWLLNIWILYSTHSVPVSRGYSVNQNSVTGLNKRINTTVKWSGCWKAVIGSEMTQQEASSGCETACHVRSRYYSDLPSHRFCPYFKWKYTTSLFTIEHLTISYPNIPSLHLKARYFKRNTQMLGFITLHDSLFCNVLPNCILTHPFVCCLRR